jgi:hypothetical protein
LIASVALDLSDEQGHVVSFELVGSEYFGSCAVEVVFLRPRRSPFPLGLVSIEESVVVDEVAVAVDLVVLVDLCEVLLPCFKHEDLIGFGLGHV